MAQPGDVYCLDWKFTHHRTGDCHGNGTPFGNATFTGAISLWLWFTVLFANFAEALAEGRSKAQANSLKGVKNRLCAQITRT